MPSSHWNEGKLPIATLIGLCRLEMLNYFKLRSLEFRSEERKLNRQFMRKCQMQMGNLCGTFQLSSIPTSIPSAFACQRLLLKNIHQISKHPRVTHEENSICRLTWSRWGLKIFMNWFSLVWAARCDKWGPRRFAFEDSFVCFLFVKIFVCRDIRTLPKPQFHAPTQSINNCTRRLRLAKLWVSSFHTLLPEWAKFISVENLCAKVRRRKQDRSSSSLWPSRHINWELSLHPFRYVLTRLSFSNYSMNPFGVFPAVKAYRSIRLHMNRNTDNRFWQQFNYQLVPTHNWSNWISPLSAAVEVVGACCIRNYSCQHSEIDSYVPGKLKVWKDVCVLWDEIYHSLIWLRTGVESLSARVILFGTDWSWPLEIIHWRLAGTS